MALLALGRITGEVGTLRAAVDVLAPLRHGSSTPARWSRSAPRWARRARAAARRSSSPSAAARPCSPRRPEGLLVATGARPRRAQLTGAAALTAAQERVARLAAGGLGNRAIAERLFVTEKTVEGHLAAAYRKLGIGSRSQLEAALRPDPVAGA